MRDVEASIDIKNPNQIGENVMYLQTTKDSNEVAIVIAALRVVVDSAELLKELKFIRSANNLGDV